MPTRVTNLQLPHHVHLHFHRSSTVADLDTQTCLKYKVGVLPRPRVGIATVGLDLVMFPDCYFSVDHCRLWLRRVDAAHCTLNGDRVLDRVSRSHMCGAQTSK